MNIFQWMGKIFSEYWQEFFKGALRTMEMALVGTVVGFLIGLLVALVRTVPVSPTDGLVKRWGMKAVNTVLSAYVEIIRGTPMMVQALIIHYSLFVPLKMPPMLSAMIIISFNTGAYMAEIVRGGIISVDKGQFEGAASIGMTHWQTMIHVVIPQLLRNILPSIGNEFVVNIKDSSVLSVIAITELMFTSKQAGGTYAKFVPAYVICAVIYFVLTYAVTRLLRVGEKFLEGKNSYTVFGSQSSSDAEIHVKKAPEEEIPND